MKVHFVRNDLAKRTFWISASKEEALQFHSKLDLDDIFNYQDNLNYIGEAYFMVAEDLSDIQNLLRVFPISNMWNGQNPWCRFDVDINNLDDLTTLDASKVIGCYEDPIFEDEYTLNLCGKTYTEVAKTFSSILPNVAFVRESSRDADSIFRR